MSKARALFNLNPIRDRMATSFNMAAVNEWAANGGKWRIALVSLETGKLRYVTEAGRMLERDGTAVLDFHAIPPACLQLSQNLNALQGQADVLQAEIEDIGAELKGAAPGQKGGLAAAIRVRRQKLRDLTAKIDEARRLLDQCRSANGAPPMQLSDLRPAILASGVDSWHFSTGVYCG